MLNLMSAEAFGTALLGRVDDPATGSWARAQLRRTTLATVVSAMDAVCEFTSDSWISQVDVPTAVIITTGTKWCRQAASSSWPGRSRAHQSDHLDADHGACVNAPHLFARALLEACWSVEPGRGSTLRTPA